MYEKNMGGIKFYGSFNFGKNVKHLRKQSSLRSCRRWNTSVKDETTLYVKGSGTQLATIKAEEFVMSRARLNEIMKTEYPGNDTEREAAYLADVMAAVTDADKTKRPSVEALLHNLFAYTYVLHVHPTLVNGLTCGKGAKALSEQLLGKEVLWIDICKPGYTLARICYEKMNAYKEEFGKDVQVLLLQNHGIFVAANTVEEIGVLFDGVITNLEKQVKRTADVSDAVTPEKELLHRSFPSYSDML